MANITPATPLPWRLFRHGITTITIEVSGPEPMKLGERPCVVGWPGFDSTDLDQHENLSNARYMIHASNAYPMLVQALRKHVRCEDSGDEATAILRQLGEIE